MFTFTLSETAVLVFRNEFLRTVDLTVLFSDSETNLVTVEMCMILKIEFDAFD